MEFEDIPFLNSEDSYLSNFINNYPSIFIIINDKINIVNVLKNIEAIIFQLITILTENKNTFLNIISYFFHNLLLPILILFIIIKIDG
jgi:hypothetical protein